MGRPSKPILSRSLLLDSTLKIIDKEGSDSISMRRLAQDLKVHPSSLYNYFSNKSELIEEIRGLIASEIDSRPLEELAWESGVLAWAKSYRAAFARHPRAVPLLMSVGASSNIVLEMYERFAAAALRSGWDSEEVVPLLSAIESFILGSVLDMSGPNFLFDGNEQEQDFPIFTACLKDTIASVAEDGGSERAFEMGLIGLIRGIHGGSDSLSAAE